MNLINKPIVYLTLLFALAGGIKNEALAINSKKEAYNTFEKIMQIPQNQTIFEQREVARLYVFDLADYLGNQDGIAKSEEVKHALRKLNEVAGKIADKYFGNRNGKTEPKEMNEMGNSMYKYPGLEELTQMYTEYKP